MSRTTLKASLIVAPVVALAMACGLAFAQDGGPSGPAKEIASKMGKLRSMPDDERAKVTKDLALEIRALPASKDKSNLAGSLSNLATEGDFGRDTLQEVTDTLTLAIKDSASFQSPQMLDFEYTQLAKLFRYEGMNVDLDNAEFKNALAKVDALDTSRAKIDFTLKDLSGKSWTRSELKGKVVLVNFWATWCPPCRKEMPDLETLYNRFKDKGFVILAISDEDAAKVRPFIDENKYTFPVLLDPGRKVNTEFQIDGIPKSFIYDRNGKLVAQTIDMRTQQQFLELLAKAGLK